MHLYINKPYVVPLTGQLPHKQHSCRNCGESGHLYKCCSKPIMSFGIICYRQNEDNVEYLMIQRRDSLSFMEFIRGKYELMNITYIKRLMSNMTIYERELLLIDSFDELWNKVWYQPIPRQTQEYLDAKDRYTRLKQGYHINKNFVNMYHILREINTTYTEPEWGFPKGRRRLKEKDVDCAVREFCEETGVTKNDLELDENHDPNEEIFFGTNDIKYRHVYYVSKMKVDPFRPLLIDPNNPHQVREVRQIKWFRAEDIIKNIRDHNIERKDLFLKVHNKILELLPL